MSKWKRLVPAGVVLLFGLSAADRAGAGCTCTCTEGEMKPACTNVYDIPPVCPLKTCPFVPRANGPALGARSRCKLVTTCDKHGFCTSSEQC